MLNVRARHAVPVFITTEITENEYKIQKILKMKD